MDMDAPPPSDCAWGAVLKTTIETRSRKTSCDPSEYCAPEMTRIIIKAARSARTLKESFDRIEAYLKFLEERGTPCA